MLITAFNIGLHRRGYSLPPLSSSYQAMKQRLVYESVNEKLIMLNDAIGAETRIGP
jgi:hypothetical protein